MTLVEVQQIAAKKSFRLEEMNGSAYKHASVGMLSIASNECHLGYYLKDDRITELLILLSDAAGDRLGFPPAPPFWERRGEVAFLREWVQRETGKKPPAKFDWGEIGAAFDECGGFACIFFRYRT